MNAEDMFVADDVAGSGSCLALGRRRWRQPGGVRDRRRGCDCHDAALLLARTAHKRCCCRSARRSVLFRSLNGKARQYTEVRRFFVDRMVATLGLQVENLTLILRSERQI